MTHFRYVWPHEIPEGYFILFYCHKYDIEKYQQRKCHVFKHLFICIKIFHNNDENFGISIFPEGCIHINDSEFYLFLETIIFLL